MVVAKKYILIKHFEGEPKPTDLKLVEETLPAIKDGEFLAEAEYLSADPYMRIFTRHIPVNGTMIGGQVAKIIESKDPNFPVGKKVFGYFGWRTHSIVNGNVGDDLFKSKPYVLPDFGDLPSSLGLGVLGMPGNTAYFGLMEICKPKAGETLVVSGAGGAVGSHVGQLGKNLGLKVIGIAGSDEKCKWLTKTLGFDRTINYKTQNVAAELKKHAPKGIDCYFDNVGGEISSTVIYQMNTFGRVSVCGAVSSYNSDVNALPKCTMIQAAAVPKQLKIEGFVVYRWVDRWNEGILKNLELIRQKKLVYRETVTDGFDKMFDAFVGVLGGASTGKAVVKV